ncbi:MAG: hypothetical protein WD186_00580 [Actinomycetota bacterium]
MVPTASVRRDTWAAITRARETTQAGDIVGYVGMTGASGAGVNHNHFEYHPNVIPTSWPESAYGYSIIDDAVNPYPLLVSVC